MIDRRSCLSAFAALPLIAAAGPIAPGSDPIDTHAHVFTRALPVAARRRYSVDYDATPAAYLAMLAANGMRRGILVQPSFLGFDNSYLLAALALHPDRLRGIAAVPSTVSRDDLARLARGGIVGIRLNLIGRNDPDFTTPDWQRHLALVASLGWQVEVQCEAARLPSLLPALIAAGSPVVIDHFGRPDAVSGLGDPGFAYLLSAASGGRVYVKLSGAYRVGVDLANAAAPMLLDAFGPDRLLWGRDWPHTQFETAADPRSARAALDRWVPDAAARAQILGETPAALFGFAPPPPTAIVRRGQK